MKSDSDACAMIVHTLFTCDVLFSVRSSGDLAPCELCTVVRTVFFFRVLCQTLIAFDMCLTSEVCVCVCICACGCICVCVSKVTGQL